MQKRHRRQVVQALHLQLLGGCKYCTSAWEEVGVLSAPSYQCNISVLRLHSRCYCIKANFVFLRQGRARQDGEAQQSDPQSALQEALAWRKERQGELCEDMVQPACQETPPGNWCVQRAGHHQLAEYFDAHVARTGAVARNNVFYLLYSSIHKADFMA